MFTLSWLLLIFLVSCFHIVHAISIVGPVLAETFPSPSIIKVGEAYYAFSSRANREGKVINTPIATSNHFQSGWTHLNKDALPHPGQWTVSPEASVLVPDINQLARDPTDGSFILYYIAIPKTYPCQQHCVAAATSHSITGPYTPQAHPLLCPKTTQQGAGTADPNGFTYEGERYLVFKNASGHDPGKTCYIAIERVEANGYAPVPGSRWIDLLDSTSADENDVEGSVLVRNPSNGNFVLFFTAGTYNTTNLRIEYATAEKVLGPYTRRGTLLKTGRYGGVDVVSPVGLDVVSANASEAVFEAWRSEEEDVRVMYTVVLRYEGDVVTIV